MFEFLRQKNTSETKIHLVVTIVFFLRCTLFMLSIQLLYVFVFNSNIYIEDITLVVSQEKKIASTAKPKYEDDKR